MTTQPPSSSPRPPIDYGSIAEKVITFPFKLIGYIFEFLAACIVVPIEFIASKLFPETEESKKAAVVAKDHFSGRGSPSFFPSSSSHSSSSSPSVFYTPSTSRKPQKPLERPLAIRTSPAETKLERLKREFPNADPDVLREQAMSPMSVEAIISQLTEIFDQQIDKVGNHPLTPDEYVDHKFKDSRGAFRSEVSERKAAAFLSVTKEFALDRIYKISGDGNCFLYSCIVALFHDPAKIPRNIAILKELLAEFGQISEKQMPYTLPAGTLGENRFSKKEDFQIVLEALEDPKLLYQDMGAGAFSRVLRFILHYKTIEPLQREGFDLSQIEDIVSLTDKRPCGIQLIQYFDSIFDLGIKVCSLCPDADTTTRWVAKDNVEPNDETCVIFHNSNHYFVGHKNLESQQGGAAAAASL